VRYGFQLSVGCIVRLVLQHGVKLVMFVLVGNRIHFWICFLDFRLEENLVILCSMYSSVVICVLLCSVVFIM